MELRLRALVQLPLTTQPNPRAVAEHRNQLTAMSDDGKEEPKVERMDDDDDDKDRRRSRSPAGRSPAGKKASRSRSRSGGRARSPGGDRSRSPGRRVRHQPHLAHPHLNLPRLAPTLHRAPVLTPCFRNEATNDAIIL